MIRSPDRFYYNNNIRISVSIHFDGSNQRSIPSVLVRETIFKCLVYQDILLILFALFCLHLANPTITQRLRRGSLKSSSLFGGNSSNHQQNSASHNHVSKKEAPSANQAVASNNTTNITNTTTTATTTTSSSKQRTFFKKRRQISSRSTDSDSEGTVEINPVSNRFYDNGNVDSMDDYYCFDQKSISSERDLLYTYSRGELDNQLSPQYSQGDLWSTDDDDGGDDVISIQSFNSDRKRKRVYTRIINNKTRDDLEQFV